MRSRGTRNTSELVWAQPFQVSIDQNMDVQTSAFRISVRWSIYIINSVDKTKFLYKYKEGLHFLQTLAVYSTYISTDLTDLGCNVKC